MIDMNGVTIYGSQLGYIDAFEPETNVSSFTLDGFTTEYHRLIGLSISWLNPLSGATKLIMRPNGIATLPAGSGSQRDGFNFETKVREDDSFPDLVIAELNAGQANTYVVGSAFLHMGTAQPGRMFIGRGLQHDKNPAGNAVRRSADRIGIFNENSMTITSLEVRTDNGSAAIGQGSRFFLFAS